MRNLKTPSAICVALGLAACACTATTVINNNAFSGDNLAIPDTQNYGSVNETSIYGSNVTASGPNWAASVGAGGVLGTPDVTLLWTTGFYQTYTNWDGRGNVVQLDSGSPQGTSRIFDITFVPGGSAAINLMSFDLDAYSGAPNNTAVVVNWTIYDTGLTTVYASGQFTEPAASGGRATISPNFTGASGESLVLRFEQVQGNGGWLGLDNVTFDQVTAVPEPPVFACVGAGLGVLLLAGKRRRLKRGPSADPGS